MPAPQRNPWKDWAEVAKERTAIAKDQFRQWCKNVREEPGLFWATDSVRYATYTLGLVTAAWMLQFGVSLLQPVRAKDSTPRASTAFFDVVCTNPACGKLFKIERKFRFRSFPVVCAYCRQTTGQRALRCPSTACRGRFVPVVDKDERFLCASCGRVLADGS